MRRLFFFIWLVLLGIAPVWSSSGGSISEARQAVEIYANVEFKGGDPSDLRKIIKFSTAREVELKRKFGIFLYTNFSEDEPQYVVNSYMVKDVIVSGNKAIATVVYQRIARTKDNCGSPFIAEPPHDETVTLNLIFKKNQWWVLDPPPQRVSKQVLIDYYEYQVKEYSSIWEQKLSDPTYNEKQKANVRANRDQAVGALQTLKSLP